MTFRNGIWIWINKNVLEFLDRYNFLHSILLWSVMVNSGTVVKLWYDLQNVHGKIN